MSDLQDLHKTSDRARAVQRNTAASWALGLGIVALLLAFGPGGPGGLILIPGVITGLNGLKNAKLSNGFGHQKAVAGLVMTVLAGVITIAKLVSAASGAA